MKRFLISVATFILVASIAGAATAPLSSTVDARVDDPGAQEVRFRGTALSLYSLCMDCPYGWWAYVTQVVAGPRVTGTVLVALEVTIAGACSPGGWIDYTIGPWDEVEAYDVLG
jgi:hypothetical protein